MARYNQRRPATLQPQVDFSFSADQCHSAEQARIFAQRELALPAQAGYDEVGFRERWQKCARFGIQAMPVPTAYGGLGTDTATAVHVLEALGQGSNDNGLLLAMGAQMWSVGVPLARFGSEAQRQQWLPPMAQGEAIGAIALTEPDAGSDVFHLHTRARPADGGFRLTGAKSFVSNAPVADLFLVFAATAPQGGYFGLTGFLVERGASGLEIGAPLRKMGLETSPMAELRCQDVWVPAAAVVGEVGGGGAVLSYTLEWERGCLLAPALGTMARLLEAATAYGRARKQFGRPIAEFEAVAAQLAEMRLRLELSRLLAYRFAWRKDQGHSASLEASMVKLYVSESLRYACQTALHLHGANGYCRELTIERDWRDAMASSLYSGTTEMQHNLIAEALLRTAPPLHEVQASVTAPEGA